MKGIHKTYTNTNSLRLAMIICISHVPQDSVIFLNYLLPSLMQKNSVFIRSLGRIMVIIFVDFQYIISMKIMSVYKGRTSNSQAGNSKPASIKQPRTNQHTLTVNLRPEVHHRFQSLLE